MRNSDSVDLNRIQIFKLVIELGSFSKAAIKLGVPKSNISRNVSELESQLKTQLIYRTTRQFQATEAGRQLYEGSRDALIRLDDIVSKIVLGKKEITGMIRFTAPEDLGPILTPLVADFLRQHPQVNIDFYLTNKILKPVQDGIDVSIRAGRVTDNSLITRQLGESKFALVASASFVDRFSQHLNIEEIHKLPCITFRALGETSEWSLSNKKMNKKIIIKPVCIVDSMNALRDLAVLGVGVTPIPLVGCRKELESGQLLRVLPEWSFPDVALQVLMPPQKVRSATVRAFVDYLVHYFKNNFIWI